MSDPDPDRWLIAVHESAHAVATLVLGGRCIGLLICASGGQAHCRGLQGVSLAFMTSCGPLAEFLATETEPPTVKTPAFVEVASSPPRSGSPDFDLFASVADVPNMSRNFESDDRVVALWAITGFEHDPESWLGRIDFVRHHGRGIVATNTAAILRVARSLFIAGQLTGDQITQLFEEKNQ